MKITVYQRLPGDVKGPVLGEKDFPAPSRSKLDPSGGSDKALFKQVADYARSLSPYGTLIERDPKVEAKERKEAGVDA